MSAPFSQHARPVETLLSRLDRVKQTGPQNFLAACPGPGHERGDRHPSLAIRETDDGRVLLHCPVCQDTSAVLAALGLEFGDLYPPRPDAHGIKPVRRPFPAGDLLKLIALEATVVLIAARDMLEFGDLVFGDAGFARLAQAADRIESALSISGVRRHG